MGSRQGVMLLSAPSCLRWWWTGWQMRPGRSLKDSHVWVEWVEASIRGDLWQKGKVYKLLVRPVMMETAAQEVEWKVVELKIVLRLNSWTWAGLDLCRPVRRNRGYTTDVECGASSIHSLWRWKCRCRWLVWQKRREVLKGAAEQLQINQSRVFSGHKYSVKIQKHVAHVARSQTDSSSRGAAQPAMFFPSGCAVASIKAPRARFSASFLGRLTGELVGVFQL